MKASSARMLAAGLVFVAVAIGLVFHTGTGTPSAFGWDWVAAICPLGALESMLGAKYASAHVLICLAIAVVGIVLIGRAFCGWLCPVPFLRRVFMGKKRADTADVSPAKSIKDDAERAKANHAKAKPQLFVLIGALVSSLVCGFPVFCLVCPVGLSFASFIAIWRLFQFNDATWSIIVFPVILVLELVFARKWCHKFCPLGYLISLIAKANVFFRPRVDANACLRSSGQAECNQCYEQCNEGIDLHDYETGAPLNECTKCHSCSQVCPVSAISFKFMPGTSGKSIERIQPSGAEQGRAATSER